MTKETTDTVTVVFVKGGLTIGDQVHVAGTSFDMPRDRFMSEAEQVAELGEVYYRPLAEDEFAIPASESYLAPRAEGAQARTALLTVAEVASILRCHRQTVVSLIRKHVISAARLDPSDPKSEWRIRASSLVRFLDNDRLGDEELDELGRSRPFRGSRLALDSSTGATVGTLATVTSNQAADAMARELAEEERELAGPPSEPREDASRANTGAG